MDTEVVLIKCGYCDSDMIEDEGFISDYDTSEVLCSDCVRSCERCGDLGNDDDNWSWIYDNDRWCESCADSYANWCDGCERYHTDDTYYIQDRSGSYCENCAQDSYYCEDCGEYYMDGCDDHSAGRAVHDYSYRPDPIFHSTDKDERLFFGVEIEVEAGSRRQDSAEYAFRLEGEDLAYLKNDGSLSCGYEIVTHPMTHDYFKNEAQFFWDTLEELRNGAPEVRARSWGTGTCGVHIHISRAGFNGGAHMHRFLSLVYGNEELYSAIAGRNSTQWAKFDDIIKSRRVYDEYGNRDWEQYRSFKDKISDGRSTDRYSAVNTQNRNTLEMRIFRGSLNKRTLGAYLDLAHASVEYTRNLRVGDVTCGALQDVVFVQYIEDNAALYPDLCERIAMVIPQLLSDNLTRIG